ncbi:GcrA family cell cycle regulator [Asaia lannensis]|uniref:GcrA cell cycle regulator n=1 Tax=Asaia lannensis NBRC 102526 TaxID=1307926 RepID=A0ABT1CCK0_9PROT|nr:GcrA family cell cycle regulator [Asaia lannensis]MCO6158587.1 GcrA cell cycle regulator [Asaia lannensis NBRC 102526]GBR00771.1 hypothetical protein AA102526_2294 [Asaia lannensis NBRC 102526]
MEWTDEIISRLQTLWQEGLSTAEIGRQLSITKNAVVGKAHRLGLPPRPSPIRAAAKSRKDATAETAAAAQPAGSGEALSETPVAPVSGPVADTRTKPVMAEAAARSAQSETTAAKATPAARPETVSAPPTAPKAEPVKHVAETPAAAAETAQEAPVSSKAAPPRKPAEAKTMAPDLMLRPLLRPLTADTSPRRGPSCCWPNGDPGTPGFHFCGAKPVPGKPYCAEHCAIAYVKLRDRRESAG